MKTLALVAIVISILAVGFAILQNKTGFYTMGAASLINCLLNSFSQKNG